MAGRKEEAYFDEAERLYVKENKTPEQIAVLLPVSQNTLYQWRTKGGWEKKRQVSLTSPRNLADKLRRILERQIEGLEGENAINPGAYDAIYKAFKAIEKLEKAQDLRVLAIEVMKEFVDWLKAKELSAGELEFIGGRIRDWFRSLE